MYTEEQWLETIPHIRRLAVQAANRLNASVTVRDELCAEAVSHVGLATDAFDPKKASFSTWCYAVLRNRCVSLIRTEASQRRQRKAWRAAVVLDAEQRLREGPAPSAAEEREEAAIREARRVRFDLVKVFEQHLEPTDRLLLATYAGVLEACGKETVARWCCEAKCEDAEALLAITKQPQKNRKRALSQLFGEKLSWVAMRIFRAVQMLKLAGGGGTEP